MALELEQFRAGENFSLLKPCWIAGERKYSSTHFAKLFARHEINAIDVVAISQQIHDIIDSSHDKAAPKCALQTRNCELVAFRDITRLAFGASYILGQQVATLLDETKNLLDQIMGNKFKVSIDVRPQSQGILKRKRIISHKTTSVCVSKRAKIEEPQLLDEQNVEYYRHMLTESQQWNTQDEAFSIEQTIQVARNCLSEHVISVTHELTFTAIDQDVIPDNGFGESIQPDITALEEFLPIRNSLKRKSSEHSPTGVLCCKMPRQGGSELDVSTTVDLCPGTEEIVTLPLPPPSRSMKKKTMLKKKSLVDDTTELSNKTLKCHREDYLKTLKPVKPKVKQQKIKKNGRLLLTSFRQIKLFPGRLKMRFQPSSEDLELTCENTIRTIFGADYIYDLAREILAPVKKQRASKNTFAPEMPITEPSEPTTSQKSNNMDNNNNNNNDFQEEIKSYKGNHFDSYNVMMNLLSIWRNNPDQKSIDANEFVKSFPDRISAALAFSHLLTLTRDGFIKLSKKPGSLEIDAIFLDKESNRLIENIWSTRKV